MSSVDLSLRMVQDCEHALDGQYVVITLPESQSTMFEFHGADTAAPPEHSLHQGPRDIMPEHQSVSTDT